MNLRSDKVQQRYCFRKEVTTTSSQCERSALCSTCPTHEDILLLLRPLGFALSFHMEAQKTFANAGFPPLPAQYHYTGPQGSEVIYLAGPDRPNAALAPHASRFWIYFGASPTPRDHVMHVLAHAFDLTWHETAFLEKKTA